jgi:hypothetical protein
MWSDSKVTVDDLSYKAQKIITVRGDIVGCAGKTQSIEKWLHWYRGSRRKPIELLDDDDVDVLVLSKGGLYVYNDSSYREMLVDERYVAIGAGAPIAYGALDFGATPREAIEIACARSVSCGLPVQEYLL